MPSLSLGKVLFIFAEECGVANHFTRRKNDEGFQAQIGTDRGLSRGQVSNVPFYQDGHEVAVCTVLGDGDTARLRPIRQGTGPHDSEWFIHLGNGEVASIPAKGIVGVGSRLVGYASS